MGERDEQAAPRPKPVSRRGIRGAEVPVTRALIWGKRAPKSPGKSARAGDSSAKPDRP